MDPASVSAAVLGLINWKSVEERLNTRVDQKIRAGVHGRAGKRDVVEINRLARHAAYSGDRETIL